MGGPYGGGRALGEGRKGTQKQKWLSGGRSQYAFPFRGARHTPVSTNDTSVSSEGLMTRTSELLNGAQYHLPSGPVIASDHSGL